MPIIESHHKLLLEPEEAYSIGQNIGKNSSDINALITNITFDILKDSPALVADVANGAVSKELLYTAIVKDIDANKYHCGIYRDELIQKIFDYMFGYGELQTYIDDEEITDIDGTRYNEFFIKRRGKRYRVPVNFGSEKAFETYCKLVAIRNGGILNENDSHCRVTDENRRLRINVSIKPRNLISPSICIRKHRKKSYTMDTLVSMGMMDSRQKEFFVDLARSDRTVIFCGKGAAGKTTLLRAFINKLPEAERVLVVESDAEIFPEKACCIEQRVKKQNEGGRPVSLRDLVKDGLTMSLDTYCVGEIVGDEAWEFIKAAHTGHRCLATTHSESAAGVFGRLLTLSKGAGIGESEATVKEMIGASIDYIVYLKDFKIDEVIKVQGFDSSSNKLVYHTVTF